MADNYLERKMEDLRNGRISPSKSIPSSSGGKGLLSFPFPAKRVLIVGSGNNLQMEIISSFKRNGCRVACFSDNREAGEKLMQTGVRFHPVDFDETGDIETNFSLLMRAWRDLDIMIICYEPCCTALIDEWNRHKQKFPIPSDYGGRIITIGFTIANHHNDKADNLRNLRQHGITCNSILPESPDDEKTVITTCRTALFLSLPGNTINSLPIPIPAK